MTSTVATDTPQNGEQAKPSPSLPLETWGKNERMRHVPPIGWILSKLDVDLRRRIDIVCTSFNSLALSDPNRGAVETELASLCRGLDRLADSARHGRVTNHHGPTDISGKVRDALHHAVTNLRTVDENLFGRRNPYHSFERSKAESLVAALLVVITALGRVVTVLRTSDAALDERLLDGLVTLQQPLREQPIAVP